MKSIYKTTIIIIFIMSFISSCSPSSEDLLDGNWAIDTFIYDGDDVFDEIVFVNMMSFDKNSKIVTIPKIDKELKTHKERVGSWKYVEETSKIFIDSKSKYLNGYFNLCFKKDMDNNYIKLVLESDVLYLEAAKVLSEIPTTTKLPVSCNNLKLNDEIN